MNTQGKHHAFKMVIADLEKIKWELSRPDEDVVALSVCLGARFALSNLMQLYLQHTTGELFANTNLEQMLIECKKYGTEFEKIDLSDVLCHELSEAECKGRYCLDINRVNDCVKIADQLKEIILKKLAINEAELV